MAHHSPLFLSIAAVAILAELVWRLRSGRGYDGCAALTTAGLVAGNLVAGALHAAVLAAAFTTVWACAERRRMAESSGMAGAGKRSTACSASLSAMMLPAWSEGPWPLLWASSASMWDLTLTKVRE